MCAGAASAIRARNAYATAVYFDFSRTFSFSGSINMEITSANISNMR